MKSFLSGKNTIKHYHRTDICKFYYLSVTGQGGRTGMVKSILTWLYRLKVTSLGLAHHCFNCSGFLLLLWSTFTTLRSSFTSDHGTCGLVWSAVLLIPQHTHSQSWLSHSTFTAGFDNLVVICTSAKQRIASSNQIPKETSFFPFGLWYNSLFWSPCQWNRTSPKGNIKISGCKVHQGSMYIQARCCERKLGVHG